MRKKIATVIAFFLLAADAAAQAAAPPSMSGSLLQMLFGLLGILALLVGSLWLLKKLTMQRGSARLMRVVAATPVGGRERVVVLEVGSTWLVLGVAPGRVSALAEIPRQSLPEEEPGSGGQATWLQRLTGKPTT